MGNLARLLSLGPLVVALTVTPVVVNTVSAQECTFHPVSPPLPDLGPGEYYRLTGRSGTSPSTWTFVRQPGITGGLYPGGTNLRPSAHDAAGLALAASIQPLDASGAPSATGVIGFASIGMSNTVHGFSAFMNRARVDADINDRVAIVNGAAGGGVVESWTIDASRYQSYWDWFNSKIASARLTHAQIQVVWAEMTSISLNNVPFPDGAHTLEGRILLLMRELKARLPNLKMVFLSTRTRSFNYFAGEPVGFEQAFAVKWLIERQINGDAELNYDAASGPASVPWLSWGPYLWVDGPTPRSDGRAWPLSYTDTRDCLHPTATGYAEMADMILQFFKSDTVATPWFLDGSAPPPPPPPPPPADTTPPVISAVSASQVTQSSATVNWTTNEPASGQVEFVDLCPASGCVMPPVTTLTNTHAIPVTGLSAGLTYRYAVRSTDGAGNTAVSAEHSFSTPVDPPPPPPGGGAISSWGFGSSVLTDDVNGCSGCENVGAIWADSGIYSGAFQFGGAAYLNLGTFPHLNNRSAFTLSMWVRPGFDSASPDIRYLFADGDNMNVVHLDRNRPWRVSLRTTTGTVTADAAGIEWTVGTWHQLAVTYSGMTLKLYWDGVLVRTATAGGGAVAPDSGRTYLGTNSVRTNRFSGDIDELRVYDRPLTDAEVYASYLDPGR